MKEPLAKLGQEVMSPTFPASVLSVSRDEFGYKEDNPNAKGLPLKMNVTGTLPPDLQGHVFIIGATGSINSPEDREHPNTVFPSQDGTTPLYNGDGMVYRLDFDKIEEGVFLSTRLIKTPCYYADVATVNCNKYEKLKFQNLGITRVGPLGTRNQLNTAFLPMKFSEKESERLLVTWDVGRPYEIDTKTLEVVTPVGKNEEWEEVSKVSNLTFKPTPPFKTIQSSAHPCFDPYTKEMFTVNVGRSLSNVFSQFIPIAYLFKELWDWIKSKIKQIFYGEKDVKIVLPPEQKVQQESWYDKLLHIVESFLKFFRAFIGIFTDNFVYIIHWEGSKPLKKWKVMHKGFPVKIKETTHQMGLTKKYIVLVDTAFKLSVEEILPTIKNREGIADYNKWKWWEKIARNYFDHPQLKDNRIYIIPRDELKSGQKYVQAYKVIIPGEAAHFLVDYNDNDDLITMHLAQVCAWDAAEWITEFDFDDDDSPNFKSQHLQRLYGAIAGPMDISKLGCHVFNVKTGELIRKNQDVLMDVDYSWGAAIYAYRERPFPERLEDIYWSCLGCWDDLKTTHITQLYKNYQYRQVGLDLLNDITKKGKNSSLLRLHIEPLEKVQDGENRLSIPDAYLFPDGYWAVSPQFIPRNENGSSTDGYIICIVHYGDGSDETNGNQLWIFDAADLKSGPKCKLWHPQFNLGFTIHTSWLPKVERRTSSYCIDTYEDYQASVTAQKSELIQDLFNNWVYPRQEP